MKTLPLILFVSFISTGCASTTPDPRMSPSYPVAYQRALADFDGTGEVDENVIDDFVNFLSNLGADNTAERAAELYAEDLYFSDALMLTNSKGAVVKHFRGLVEGGASVEVEMLDVLVQDTDIYLVWLMTASFQPIRKNRYQQNHWHHPRALQCRWQSYPAPRLLGYRPGLLSTCAGTGQCH